MTLKLAEGEQLKKIQDFLGVTEETINEDVKCLQEWLLKQPHLPNDIDERILRSFVTGCKSLEKCKTKLDQYLTARTIYAALFANRDPAEKDPNYCVNQFWFRNLTPNGERIYYWGFSGDPYKLNFQQKEGARTGVNYMDYRFIVDDCYVSSVIFIMDAKHMTPMFATVISPTITQQIIKCLWKCVPYRVSKLIFFNSDSFTEQLVNKLVKPFLGKKLIDRIFITTKDHSVLSEFNIPQEMLPEDYGGKEPSCKELTQMYKEETLKNRAWFITEGRKGSDESKRPDGQPPSIDFIEFGLEGTFKSLSVD